MNADEIRQKILEEFEKFKPHLQGYYEYAQRVDALGSEYHRLILEEELGRPYKEMILVATLDARETPKSLDTTIAQLHQSNVRLAEVILDRKSGKFLLFASV